MFASRTHRNTSARVATMAFGLEEPKPNTQSSIIFACGMRSEVIC